MLGRHRVKNLKAHVAMVRQRLERSLGTALGAAARELPLDGPLLGRLYRNFTETVRGTLPCIILKP